MARPSPQSIAFALHSLTSPDDRLAALRALKNELIGHEEKKELWVRSGVLGPLREALNIPKGSGGTTPKRYQGRSEQEEARLQAIVIVGSIAQGGAPYISPLYTSGVLPPLLDVLSPHQTSPSTLLAALRTLNTIADSRLLQHPLRRLHPDTLTDLLYTENHLHNVAEILSQASSDWSVQQQISLASSLISKTCQEEHHRALLEQAGFLSVLATKIASFVVATSCSDGTWAGCSADTPLPATEKAELAPILDAVCAIAQTSKARWQRFISNPFPYAMFSDRTSSFPASGDLAYKGQALNGSPSYSHPTETFLPHIRASHKPLPNTSNFPPLGTIGTSTQPLMTAFGLSDYGWDDDETPLIPWLLYIARAEASGIARLVALQAITNLFRCGLTFQRREGEFATLLVPLLATMLERQVIPPKGPSVCGQQDNPSERLLLEHKTPAVLATLVVDSIDLQKAAIDAGVIKRLSNILKKSFDPLPPSATASLWSPEPQTSDVAMEDAPTLGHAGLSPQASHVTKLREATLTGLAALASLRDDHRKSIIENGVVSCVIQSLKPYSIDSSSLNKPAEDFTNQPQVVTENPKEVILAACALARGLSRSVSTLRTSLMDAGLAAPLFLLLKHQDVDLQIAATAVVCNLVLEFSPMREAIVEGGILKILCEHAHSVNTKLLLNSIWALKHLVLSSPISLKMNCLDELGPGWLKQIIRDGTEELNASRERESVATMGMGTSNAAGMQVDLLNAVDTDSTKIEDEEGDVRMSDSEPDRRQSRPKRTPNPPSSRAGSLSIRHSDDDLSIQKESLEFIRNLICGPGAKEMIDVVFSELGQDKFFELIRCKLALRVISTSSNTSRRSSTNPSSYLLYNGRLSPRQLQTSSEICASIVYILMHIAAGLPRHRQILMAQTELLKCIVPLFGHEMREIRVSCAWLVINLTWMDDESDRPRCRACAKELMRLGYFERLKTIENDTELDVKERSKTALHQMGNMLR